MSNNTEKSKQQKRPPLQLLSEAEARENPLELDAPAKRILIALAANRFLTAEQGASLLQITRQGWHKRLKTLRVHRYIKTVLPDEHRHIYALDVLGSEYVAQSTGIPLDSLRARSRITSSYFLAHYLAITDVYVALAIAAKRAQVDLEWWSELDVADHYDRPADEPGKLEPDAVFTLAGAAAPSTIAFLEVDLATSSMQLWQKKIADYNAYFLTGRFAEKWGGWARVVVLVVVPNEKRARKLLKATEGEWRAQVGENKVAVGFAEQSVASSDDVLQIFWAGLQQEVFPLWPGSATSMDPESEQCAVQEGRQAVAVLATGDQPGLFDRDGTDEASYACSAHDFPS